MYDSNYATSIKSLPNYAAADGLSNLIRWKDSESGHIATYRTSGKLFIGVAIAQVSSFKLNCAPNGNYIKIGLGSLPQAKFQFYGVRPGDNNFAADFTKVFANLTKLQRDVAVTKDQRDMLRSDTTSGPMIRFAKPVFAERVRFKSFINGTQLNLRKDKIIPDSPTTTYYEDVMNPPTQRDEHVEKIDDETNNWPIHEKYRDELDFIKPTHMAKPLHVYKGEEFVEPNNVNNEIRGALVEIQFSIHHSYLGSQQQPRDSFRANIEQISILDEGQDFDEKGYADISPRSGPIAPSSTAMKRDSSSQTKRDEAAKKRRLDKGKKRADVTQISQMSETAESSQTAGYGSPERLADEEEENEA